MSVSKIITLTEIIKLLKKIQQCGRIHPTKKTPEGVLKVWAGVDSNHRTLAGTDLQSVAFSHSATYPYLVLYIPPVKSKICAFTSLRFLHNGGPEQCRLPPRLRKSFGLTPLLKLPLTRLELVTSPLPRECSTSEPQGLKQ